MRGPPRRSADPTVDPVIHPVGLTSFDPSMTNVSSALVQCLFSKSWSGRSGAERSSIYSGSFLWECRHISDFRRTPPFTLAKVTLRGEAFRVEFGVARESLAAGQVNRFVQIFKSMGVPRKSVGIWLSWPVAPPPVASRPDRRGRPQPEGVGRPDCGPGSRTIRAGILAMLGQEA